MNEHPMTGTVFFLGMALSAMFSIGIGSSAERFTIKTTRQETISYCVEKPDDCKLEYNYLKLKETQTK